MKYLVVSDIHGIYDYAKLIPSIFKREGCKELILLGDLFYHGLNDYDRSKLIEMYNSFQDKVIGIKGNNDTPYDMLDLKFNLDVRNRLLINDVMFHFEHGHLLDEYEALNVSDVLVFGHTHKCYLRKTANHIVCNLGSISLPRDNNHCYMIIDDKMIYIKDLDGNVIDSTNYLIN